MYLFLYALQLSSYHAGKTAKRDREREREKKSESHKIRSKRVVYNFIEPTMDS